MHKLYRSIITAVSWLCISNSILAQTSIDAVLQKTVLTHPDITSARAQKEAVLQEANQTQVGPNPELELNAGQKSDATSSGLTIETTLKQTLRYPGKLEAKKRWVLGKTALQDIELQKLKLKLHYAIWAKSYEWDSANQQFAINQRRIRKLHWINTYLSSRPFVSPQKRLESNIVEAHLKAYQMEGIQLNAQKSIARVALQNLMTDPLPESLPLPAIPAASPQWEKLHAKLKDQNPDIQQMKAQLTQIDLETHVLKIEGNPDFDLLGRYAAETASETERFFSFGIGMTLPITNQNRFAIQAQAQQKKAVEAQLIQVIKDKETQWQEALILLNRSQEILNLYTPAWMNRVETGLDQAIEDFKKGQVDLLSILELESQWMAVSDIRLEAQTEWVTAWSTLMQLIGEIHSPGDTL